MAVASSAAMYRGVFMLTFALPLVAGGPTPAPDNVAAIVARSVAANERDWSAAPMFDHCERDDDGDTAKTYDVTMIDGTPYRRLVAVDDRPLGPSEMRDERRKLEKVVVERRAETPRERQDRLHHYHHTRDRIRGIMRELGRAFVFESAGRRKAGGRDAIVLHATPRPGYTPPTRDARALAGMQAEFWIDARTLRWIRVAGRVIHPVSIVGWRFVSVEPGTTLLLEKSAIEAGVWAIAHLQIRADSRVAWFVPHRSWRDERDFDYRRSALQRTSECRSTAIVSTAAASPPRDPRTAPGLGMWAGGRDAGASIASQ